jgi:hypothetical protein
MSESRLLQQLIASIEDGSAVAELIYSLPTFPDLEGDDRLRAVAYLLARADEGDLRAIETLADLGVAEAIEPLKSLSDRPADVGPAAARAALDISHRHALPVDQALVDRVAGAASGRGAIASGLAAAQLRRSSGSSAVQGLLDALLSPYATTRANASLGLRKKLDLESLIEPRQSPLWALLMRVMAELEAVWRPAAAEARDLLGQMAAGATAEELGFVYRRTSEEEDIAAFWKSADSYSIPWNKEAWGRLSGHDREWANSYMLATLWDRPETAEVLLELGVEGARPAIEEAAARFGSGPLPNQFARALASG